MDACIDVGNTFVKVALFEKDELTAVHRNEVLDKMWFDEMVMDNNVQRVILSSVRVNLDDIIAHLDSSYDFYQLDHKLPIPISNDYATPKTLGKDRLAAAVGAHAIFPSQNCLVIDAGTCITLDVIDEKGHFLGGSIAPGLNMRLSAMHHFTSALPKVLSRDFEGMIGKNTEESMLVGALNACAIEIDGIIDYFNNEYTELKVLFTGGSTSFFEKKLKNQIFARPNLVLTGLHQILKFNAQN